MELETHPAANEFPMFDEKRLAQLAGDIKQNGQREPIRLFEGRILDGRNRYAACQKINLEPKTKTLPGDIDPYAYIWSLNGERRDLSADQRYLIWKSCSEKSEAWQKEEQRIREEANQARSEAAKQQERIKTETGKTIFGSQVVGQVDPLPEKEHKSRQAKATASKTNRETVKRMDRLSRDRPDLAQQVCAGELKSAAALRTMTKEAVADKIQELPEDKYRVIYADPPWSYNDKISGDLSASYGAAEKHYPSMSLTELKNLDVPSLCQDDAVLFLWVTSPLLPEGIELVRAWGFKYKASFVWDKVKHNMGHYNSVRHEFLLIATKGSCTPDETKLFDSVQSIERSKKHSEKPEQFRKIIEALYLYGKKIELFSRQQSEGWAAWGNEL